MDAASPSQIAASFAGQNVFLTGGTGFLGKVLIEKLLRSCPDVGTIYMLSRPKKGKSAQERINAIFQEQLFDVVRTNNPEQLEKVVPLLGDVMEPQLGMSEEDIETVVNNANIVYHSAATLRFNEEIKIALKMNVGGTVKMIELARKIKNLVTFVHVSTAYGNCNLNHIEEICYDMGTLDALKLLELTDWMDGETMAAMTQPLLQGRPNTYCLTKALAEQYIFKHAADLPLAVFRPSIIGAGWKEPIAGWIDNLNGPSGLFIAIGKGVLRILEGDVNKVADIVPIDYCINMLITITWYTQQVVSKVDKPIIYHCTSGAKKPFTWFQIGTIILEYFQTHPYSQVFRRPNVNFATNKLELMWWKAVSHYVPAYIADSIFVLLGKKTRMLYAYDKVHKASLTFTFFTTKEWTWSAENYDMLLKQVSEHDKKEFDFNIEHIDWKEYYHNYILGTKKFILKEEVTDKTLEEARKQQIKLRNIYYLSTLIFIAILAYFVKRLFF